MLPSASRIRSAKPGWADSSADSTSPTVAPSTWTSDWPAVRVRRVVGTRTVTLMEASSVGVAGAAVPLLDGNEPPRAHGHSRRRAEIGSASCRERVGQYDEVKVVAGSLKKTNQSVHHATQKILISQII